MFYWDDLSEEKKLKFKILAAMLIINGLFVLGLISPFDWQDKLVFLAFFILAMAAATRFYGKQKKTTYQYSQNSDFYLQKKNIDDLINRKRPF